MKATPMTRVFVANGGPGKISVTVCDDELSVEETVEQMTILAVNEFLEFTVNETHHLQIEEQYE
jgi:hypothetical protein